MKSKKLKLAILAAGALCVAPLANAQISGQLWENQGVNANADMTPIGSSTVSFTVPNGPLDFSSYGNSANTGNPSQDYTIGSWLAEGGATITSGAGNGGDTMDDTLIILTGFVSVTSGESFTVEQDDGLALTIGSDQVLNNPGPNAPTSYSGTYTGPTGNQAFTLEYTEIDGPGAVLDVDLPFIPTPAVPEANTLMAGAAMLIPLGLSAIRRMRKNQA